MKIEISHKGETKSIEFSQPQSKIIEKVKGGQTLRIYNGGLFWESGERCHTRPLEFAIWKIRDAFGMTSKEVDNLYDKIIKKEK